MGEEARLGPEGSLDPSGSLGHLLPGRRVFRLGRGDNLGDARFEVEVAANLGIVADEHRGGAGRRASRASFGR